MKFTMLFTIALVGLPVSSIIPTDSESCRHMAMQCFAHVCKPTNIDQEALHDCLADYKNGTN